MTKSTKVEKANHAEWHIIHVCDECNTEIEGEYCAEHPSAMVQSVKVEGAKIEEPAAGFAAFTVIDRETMERFITIDYESLDVAVRERERLALEYGKQFCLGIGAIDALGNLSDITEGGLKK
jgi:hypothetical protein